MPRICTYIRARTIETARIGNKARVEGKGREDREGRRFYGYHTSFNTQRTPKADSEGGVRCASQHDATSTSAAGVELARDMRGKVYGGACRSYDRDGHPIDRESSSPLKLKEETTGYRDRSTSSLRARNYIDTAIKPRPLGRSIACAARRGRRAGERDGNVL